MTENLKRITVWIDVDPGRFSQDYEKIEKILRSAGKRYKIISVSDLKNASDTK